MTTEDKTPQRLLDDEIEPFLKSLRSAGYAERTLRKKRTVTRAFARWAKRKRIATADVNASHLSEFVARAPRKRKARVQFELAALRLFLDYVRPGRQCLPQEDVSAAGALLRRYEKYLSQDRGLAKNSVHVYIPFIRSFLTAQNNQAGCIVPDAFDTSTIQSFLLAQTHNRSKEYSRLLATSLRSFLRFLFLSGELLRDLSTAVPMVRRHRQVAPPAFLSPEEVERILKATDRATPTGRRDYSILLLLARLGLRAGEIVALKLDDIRWRTGEIVVHGKGRMLDRLPLLTEVGEVLAAYIRDDRGTSSSRQVFLRTWAPRIGLTGPAAVGHVVRRALARAGIHRSGRGAAHLFRHGLGTQMIRQGASISEIAEVLRHRSQTTTAVYTQLSLETLRTVAQPWPTTGGAR